MTTLDDSSNIPVISEVPVRPTAMKYGGIGGLITVVMGLIFYVTEMTDPANQGSTGNTIAQILNYAVLIGAIVMAIKYHKENELGGYLTIGRSIGMGTLTGVIMGVIGAIWTVLFFTVIDPGMLETIREVAYEQAIQNGAPEDQMDQMEGMMNFFTSPTFFAIFMILGGVLIGLVTGLITGAVLKKDPPPFAA
jgi:membrane protease YdiL (CAAX protease family)